MRNWIQFLTGVGLILLSQSYSVPQEVEAAKPGRPLVTQVGENNYRIGKIRLNSKSREIRIPVTVNMREGGPMEYLLVHETGKVHESVLVTEISPLHLQIALKLLKYKAGHGDVFNGLLPPHLLEKEGGSRDERGELTEFFFQPNNSDVEIAARKMILDGDSLEPLNRPGWIHTGSTRHEGQFMAEAEGGFIAIYLDPNAMFNMTRGGADIDERWGANADAIPEIGTKGELVIRPASS
jgi:hypothetical protein